MIPYYIIELNFDSLLCVIREFLNILLIFYKYLILNIMDSITAILTTFHICGDSADFVKKWYEWYAQFCEFFYKNVPKKSCFCRSTEITKSVNSVYV